MAQRPAPTFAGTQEPFVWRSTVLFIEVIQWTPFSDVNDVKVIDAFTEFHPNHPEMNTTLCTQTTYLHIYLCKYIRYLHWVSIFFGNIKRLAKKSPRLPFDQKSYTQYCAIKNGLIKNSTRFFSNFKERVIKIFRIKNRFFSLRKIK